MWKEDNRLEFALKTEMVVSWALILIVIPELNIV